MQWLWMDDITQNCIAFVNANANMNVSWYLFVLSEKKCLRERVGDRVNISLCRRNIKLTVFFLPCYRSYQWSHTTRAMDWRTYGNFGSSRIQKAIHHSSSHFHKQIMLIGMFNLTTDCVQSHFFNHWYCLPFARVLDEWHTNAKNVCVCACVYVYNANHCE